MSRAERIRGWVVVAAVGLALAVLFLLPRICFPLAAGFLLAYASNPAATFFERRRWPRILGFVTILVAILGLLAIVLFVFLPAVVSELASLGDKLPSWREVLDERVGPFFADLRTRYPQTYALFQQHLSDWLETALPQVAQRLAHWSAGLLGSAVGLIGLALNLILIPVIAAYLSVDFHAFLAAVARLVPRPVLPSVETIAREIHGVLVAFLRGQLLVAAALGLMYTVGLIAVGAPLALVIGPLAGLLALVPYLGLVTGVASAALLSFLDYQDLLHPLLVVVVFVIAQNIEGWVLTPRLLGHRVGLHPAWVLVALLAGGELWGVTGIVIAVPVAAMLRVVLVHAMAIYTASEFYRGDPIEVRVVGAAGDAVASALEARVRKVLRSLRRGRVRRVMPEDGAPPEHELPAVLLAERVLATGDVSERALRARLRAALEEES